MHLQENTLFDPRPWVRVKVTRNVAQYHLRHVTYSGTKFEVATSNGLAGDAFTRKYIICPVLSTSCDLFRYNV